MEYVDFIKAKIAMAEPAGLKSASDIEVHLILKSHQRDIVRWALAGGRRAIFAAFGLGKSLIQLEIMRQISRAEDGRQLIIAPLGVRQEFKRDAEKLNMSGTFIRRDSEVAGPGLYLTNYESVRDGRLSVGHFNAVSLDEASVLRSYGSLTFQTFLTMFDAVKYRFVATATPSPNRYKELIHYAGFLGIMDTSQSLTRFFQRDSSKANNLTLYPHKEREFWLWVNSWAIFLQKPSDLGYSDEGYALPKLHIHYHRVKSESQPGCDKRGQRTLINDAALSLADASREKKASLPARIEKMREIIAANPAEHCIIWHDQEDERRAIKKALPAAVDIHGAMDLEERESRVVGFSNGEFKLFASKPVLSGSGCNFQRHCRMAIFLGIGFKFNDFIQAVHRLHRFLQERECHIHIIYANTEIRVLDALERKWRQHEEMVNKMTEIIRKYGLSQVEMAEELRREAGVKRIEISGDKFQVAHNDCVEECRGMGDNSVDLICTSIPFSNHYEYTPNYNDFGHTDNNGHFWAQMDFLTPELLRILNPGRIYACHVKDRILFGSVTHKGVPTVSPFHAEAIFHGQKHGFDYLGMITVVTDVVRENNQTYRLGWTEQCKDGSKMGVGSPEYILLFRKPQSDRSRARADSPVTKSKDDYSRARWQVDAHAFWRSSGQRLLTADEMAGFGPDVLAGLFAENSLRGIYDYEAHVRIGEELDLRGVLPCDFMSLAPGSHHPDVWHDVNRMLTLNGDQSRRGLTMHVCLARDSLVLTRRGYIPIQDVVEGDEVLTHKGRWRKVLVVANTGFRPVIEVKAQGVCGLRLTPDHELWTRKSDWVRQRDGAKRTAPAWIRADETLGGYINQKLPPVCDNELTEHECWILGRWLADGHKGPRGDFFVSIGKEKLHHFLLKAGGMAGAQSERDAVQIRLKSLSPCLKTILNNCGRRADGKQLAPELLTLPAPKTEALLQGYLSGDGHFLTARKRYMATSVSKSLLLGVSMLVQRVYRTIATLQKGRSAGKTVIQGRTVNTKQEWVMSFDMPTSRRKSAFVLADGAWKKVRSLPDAGMAETWCIRVEEDESFTAEGCIVKNCPLQFDIVDRIINRYSNPGELVFDPFGGLMTVPLRALKLGRRGRGVDLNLGYVLDGAKYLQAAEREISMPTLFDLEDFRQAANE